MRRWFEFGWNEDLANPKFEYRSNTRQTRRGEAGDLPAVFVSLPFKQEMLEILQGTSLVDLDPYSNFTAQIKNGGSTDAPAADCTAEHVVSGPNTLGWRVFALYTAGYWQNLIGGFPKPLGGFTPPVIRIASEPPSENG